MPWMVEFSYGADQRFAEAQRVMPGVIDLKKAIVGVLSHDPFTKGTPKGNGLHVMTLDQVCDALPCKLVVLYDVGQNQRIMVKKIKIY